MVYTGNLEKMETLISNEVQYYLNLGKDRLHLNELIGKELVISYHSKINCIKCGKETKKSFAQGFCYSCLITAPEAEECVLNPELCKAHEGIARDMEFAKEHCLIDHYVYFAASPSLKVGVTRYNQLPTRWIDQGASWATAIAKTPNRYLAGILEVELKKHFSDKTNWRLMLNGSLPEKNLLEGAISKLNDIKSNLFIKYEIENKIVTTLQYQVLRYPQKIQSINLDTQAILKGRLTGIKGQYLMFDDQVINIRKFGGYFCSLELL